MARLIAHLDNELIHELVQNDPDLLKRVKENESLLSNVEIPFKVTAEGGSPWTYMTKTFQGKIHSNGFLYLEASSNSFEWLELLGLLFPTSYQGKINSLGNVLVHCNKRRIGLLFGRVPSAYMGAITSSGTIVFKTSESWRELDGNTFVSKIIADPFKGDTQQRKAFLENRKVIRKAISDWKENYGLVDSY